MRILSIMGIFSAVPKENNTRIFVHLAILTSASISAYPLSTVTTFRRSLRLLMWTSSGNEYEHYRKIGKQNRRLDPLRSALEDWQLLIFCRMLPIR